MVMAGYEGGAKILEDLAATHLCATPGRASFRNSGVKKTGYRLFEAQCQLRTYHRFIILSSHLNLNWSMPLI